MRKVIQSIRGIIVLILLAISIVLFSTLTLICGSIAKLMPIRNLRYQLMKITLMVPTFWMDANALIVKLAIGNQFQIHGNTELSTKSWYLLLANHRTWLDILVLGIAFRHKAPIIKFFLKQELLWSLPVAGWACYLLDYPFMKRHSTQEIRKNPQLRFDDIKTARNACKKFKEHPTTIMNFIEGTRFSEEKRERQNSPYKHLLKPKGAGIGIVLEEMNTHLSGIIDTAIAYDTHKISLWDFACGNFKAIHLTYQLLPLTQDLIGDFNEDRQYRKRLQHWLNELWEQKDRTLDKDYATSNPNSNTQKSSCSMAS